MKLTKTPESCGHVEAGTPMLPDRGAPVPFDKWFSFNSELSLDLAQIQPQFGPISPEVNLFVEQIQGEASKDVSWEPWQRALL